MYNFIFWLLYYIRCAFNIIYSYCNKGNGIIQKFTNNNNKIKINDHLYIVKLYGSYYQMGQQYGILMENILTKDLSNFISFIEKNQHYFMRNLPKKFRKGDIFQSILYYFGENKKNFNNDILEFIEGVSNTSNLKYRDLLYVNLFSDIVDNHCILLSKKINKKILHLRTLDFGLPVMVHTLFCFHPNNKIPYISLNFNHLFGLYTGLSKKGIFFGESYYDFKIGELSFQGMPFHHISHKILSEANNLKESEKILTQCQRKSNLQLLISDNNNSKIYLSCIDKLNVQQEGDIVFSVTPNEKKNFDKNFHLLTDIDSVINKFIPRTKSGEMHTMVYYDNYVYISVTDNVLQSYNNSFYKFHINDLIT